MRKATILVSDTDWLVQSEKQARSLKFQIKLKRGCTICVGKTKTLISCAVMAAQLLFVTVCV